MFLVILTLFQIALTKRIASVATHADTHWRVTDNATLGIDSARTNARIFALLIKTCLATKTLAITNAFGSTIRWNSSEFRETGARW